MSQKKTIDELKKELTKKENDLKKVKELKDKMVDSLIKDIEGYKEEIDNLKKENELKEKKIIELTYSQETKKPANLPKQQSLPVDSMKSLHFNKLMDASQYLIDHNHPISNLIEYIFTDSFFYDDIVNSISHYISSSQIYLLNPILQSIQQIVYKKCDNLNPIPDYYYNIISAIITIFNCYTNLNLNLIFFFDLFSVVNHFDCKLLMQFCNKSSDIFNNEILRNTSSAIISNILNEDEMDVRITAVLKTKTKIKLESVYNRISSLITSQLCCVKINCECFIYFSCFELLSKFMKWEQYQKSVHLLWNTYPQANIHIQCLIINYVKRFMDCSLRCNELNDFELLFNKLGMMLIPNDQINIGTITWSVQIEIVEYMLKLKQNNRISKSVVNIIKPWYNSLNDLMKCRLSKKILDEIED